MTTYPTRPVAIFGDCFIPTTEISDNSIDQFKSEGKDWKLAKEKHKKLKQKHIQVKERYENLEAMTRRGGKLPGDFTEPKVVDLWLQAIKANFSEHELNSLKVGTCTQLLRA